MPWTATCKRPWADLKPTSRQTTRQPGAQVPGCFRSWPECHVAGTQAALDCLTMRAAIALLLFCLCLPVSPVPVAAKPVSSKPAPVKAPLPVREQSFATDVCRLIENRARWRGIDVHFIARLIHTESRFSPTAISPAGAQGIAQFIPSTAQMRNLKDPFDPATALTASIDYLAELRTRFGNLGLAAVAYNAGEGAAARYLAGGGIPYETENYVLTITGRPAQDWRDRSARFAIPRIARNQPFTTACPEHVAKAGPRAHCRAHGSAPAVGRSGCRALLTHHGPAHLQEAARSLSGNSGELAAHADPGAQPVARHTHAPCSPHRREEPVCCT
jgi:hypothetical protein